ncbi:MAG: SIMPL domain-containing protein [Dehalogenimonas sp.]|uniref:SIMPL domain-containing protein n=1 Tax=Candidatus Dehalogenimonas loeffleri TaxID=3127115 RepID=A0ABZ2J583_9CHLR|nr:SIMPL domain-containing protein [Dehalogenimonas sp.]
MNKKFLVLLSAVMLVALGLGAAGCAATPAATGNNQQSGIWVSGNGKVSVTPDTANISLGVQVEAVNLSDANQQTADAMDAVIAVVKAHGVPDKDIKTQGFSVYPVYDYDKDTGRSFIRGYQVSNTVEVKVRVIDQTGSVIDAAVAAGGNAVRVNNIYFSIDDLAGAQDDARELALLDAKAKAEQIARVTGVSLGKVTYVAETSSGGARVEAPAFDNKEGSVTPILPGETAVTVTVQVIYNIK